MTDYTEQYRLALAEGRLDDALDYNDGRAEPNLILQAFRQNLANPHVDEDTNEPENVLYMWLLYLETGNQDVSWDQEHIEEAWKFLTTMYHAREGKPFPEDVRPMLADDGEEEVTPTRHQLVIWLETPLPSHEEFVRLTAIGARTVLDIESRHPDFTVKYAVEEVPS